jgi:hypothetical protein
VTGVDRLTAALLGEGRRIFPPEGTHGGLADRCAPWRGTKIFPWMGPTRGRGPLRSLATDEDTTFGGGVTFGGQSHLAWAESPSVGRVTFGGKSSRTEITREWRFVYIGQTRNVTRLSVKGLHADRPMG